MASVARIERYHEPATLEEAVAALADGPATIVAGGTVVVREAQAGRLAWGQALVNLRCLRELDGIDRDGDGIRIGALTRIRDLAEEGVIAARAPVLAAAAGRMASSQVRNLGTVGGNLCWASPSADLNVPLLLLDATVELARQEGRGVARRTLTLGDFLVGSETTARAEDEILTAVSIPAAALDLSGSFRKSGTRVALDATIASVGVAAAVEGGVLRGPRVAFGGVAATAMRAGGTEAALADRRVTEATVAEAVAAAASEIDPPDDGRASAWYRRELVKTFLARLLHELGSA